MSIFWYDKKIIIFSPKNVTFVPVHYQIAKPI